MNMTEKCRVLNSPDNSKCLKCITIKAMDNKDMHEDVVSKLSHLSFPTLGAIEEIVVRETLHTSMPPVSKV